MKGKCYEHHIVQRYYQVENSLDDKMDSEVLVNIPQKVSIPFR